MLHPLHTIIINCTKYVALYALVNHKDYNYSTIQINFSSHLVHFTGENVLAISPCDYSTSVTGARPSKLQNIGSVMTFNSLSSKNSFAHKMTRSILLNIPATTGLKIFVTGK